MLCQLHKLHKCQVALALSLPQLTSVPMVSSLREGMPLSLQDPGEAVVAVAPCGSQAQVMAQSFQDSEHHELP